MRPVRRTVGYVLAGAAVVICGRWLAMRGRPERIAVYDSLHPTMRPDESEYSVRFDGAGRLLLERRSAVDASRQVPAVPATVATYALPPGFTAGRVVNIPGQSLNPVYRGAIYAEILKIAPHPQASSPFERLPLDSQNRFHPPGGTVVRHFVRSVPGSEIRLIGVPISGGPIKTVVTSHGTSDIVIQDGAAYWIDPRPEPVTTVLSASGLDIDTVATARLAVTDLDTLESHTAESGIPLNVMLRASGDGVLYVVTPQHGHISPPPSLPHFAGLQTVWYVARGMNHAVQLGDDPFVEPRQIGDAIYYAVTGYRREQQEPGYANSPLPHDSSNIQSVRLVPLRVDLRRMRADGTSITTVASWPCANGARMVSGLFRAGEQLFTLRHGAGRQSVDFCQIDLSAGGRLTKLVSLPEQASITGLQGGYLYFEQHEQYSPPLGEDPVHPITIYYRWRLPV